jgi:hypothetical protein
MTSTEIYSKFQADKKTTIQAIQEFLRSGEQQQIISNKDLTEYRQAALKYLSEGNLSMALCSFEQLRDAKNGIAMKKVQKDGVSIVFRDARGAKNKTDFGTEAFEMLY